MNEITERYGKPKVSLLLLTGLFLSFSIRVKGIKVKHPILGLILVLGTNRTYFVKGFYFC